MSPANTKVNFDGSIIVILDHSWYFGETAKMLRVYKQSSKWSVDPITSSTQIGESILPRRQPAPRSQDTKIPFPEGSSYQHGFSANGCGVQGCKAAADFWP